jgi:ubiquitin-conjugating enzyme E2 G2
MFSSRTATTGAIRRLQVEYKQLTSDPHSLFPATGPISEDDFLTWEALLPGPEDTPFEGGVFRAELKFRECSAAGCGECAAAQAR